MNFQKAFAKIKIGQSFVVPWFEIDKVGLGLPPKGKNAIVMVGGKTFSLEQTQNGMKVSRLE